MKISMPLLATLIFSLSFGLTGCGKRSAGDKKNIKTWNEFKWKNIARQGYDYSCGSASLATLTQGYFDDTWLEPVILTVLVETLPKNEAADRVKNGFSLLDLKRAANTLGYNVAGVKLKPEAIFHLAGPVIVRLKKGQWEHFTVFRGIHNDRVFLADPARGNLRIPLFEFYDQWDGTILALDKENFEVPDQYPLALDKDLPEIWPEADSLRSSPVYGRNRNLP
jgi:predicted double-glycine peptidase